MAFALAGFAYCLGSMIFGYLGDKYVSNKKLLVVGNCFMTISLVLYGPIIFDPSVSIVLGSLVISGLGTGCILVANFSVITQNAHDRNYPENVITIGRVSSVYLVYYFLGHFLGSLLAGILVDYLGMVNASCIFLIISALRLFIQIMELIFMKNKVSKRTNRNSTNWEQWIK